MLINFVIRTYNEEKYVGLLIDLLKEEINSSDHDGIITIVDSESSDNTVDIVKAKDVKLISTKKKDFNFSRNLNIGIESKKCDFVVIMSAHAIPKDKLWLDKVIEKFNDPDVAGVYWRQIPWPDANWQEKIRLAKMFPDEDKVFITNKDYSFSNASSCIRYDYWREYPFREMTASEDRDWALWAFSKKRKIVFLGKISVFHSHDETPRQVAKRMIDIHKADDIFINRKRTDFLTLKNAIGWFRKNIKEGFAFDKEVVGRLLIVKDSILQSFWIFKDFNK